MFTNIANINWMVDKAKDLLEEMQTTPPPQSIIEEVFGSDDPILLSAHEDQGVQERIAALEVENALAARDAALIGFAAEAHTREILRGEDRSPGRVSLRTVVHQRAKDAQHQRKLAEEARAFTRKAKARQHYLEVILPTRQEGAEMARVLAVTCQDLKVRIRAMEEEHKKLLKFKRIGLANDLLVRITALREAREATTAILEDLNRARFNTLPPTLKPPIEALPRDEGLATQVANLDYPVHSKTRTLHATPRAGKPAKAQATPKKATTKTQVKAPGKTPSTPAKKTPVPAKKTAPTLAVKATPARKVSPRKPS